MSKTTEEIEIRFRDGLISSQLIETESSGLLAVSGGIDSVVMAYLFAQVRNNFRLTLAIAHFNKGQHDLGLSIDRMQGSAVLQNWVEFQSIMVSTNVSDFNL